MHSHCCNSIPWAILSTNICHHIISWYAYFISFVIGLGYIHYHLSAAPTGPPQNIIAPVVEGTYLTLSWEPPISSEQNGIITSYRIKVTTEDGVVLDNFTSDTTYTVSNLEPYSIYQFSVAALTVHGQGPFSSNVAIRTGETGKQTRAILHFF